MKKERLEKAIADQRSVLKDILKWNMQEQHDADQLKKKGIRTVFCQQSENARTIKILEQRRRYTLMVDGNAIHTTDSLDSIVSWGKVAGYIDKRDNVTRYASKRTPTPAATRKSTTATTPAKRPKTATYEPLMTWTSSLTIAERERK